ncbi:hypothetical protein CMI47_06965 [Candidatus Pacearchaeota archaeon]|nr:hypothetical protein [Candidatus Pacearchaeota archaeon]|tara:strand:- start:118 stop:498 length:381 start_codon:yes stop_codon:yes gene_type:complete
MLNFEETNCIGQILNDTFGKSSTVTSPTMSIKGSLAGDVLTLKYTTVVNLASERNLRDQVRVFEEESVKLIKEYVKNLKKEFKSDASRALKVKELNTDDSVEMITTSPYTPRKIAYYRRSTRFSCE